MKTVLVTGGAGYIGSVLVRLLLDSGYRVRVLDNLRFGGNSLVELFNHPNFEFQKGDIRNSADLETAMQSVTFAAHLAAIVGDPACAKEPDLARATNLEAGQRAFEIAEKCGLQRFVFASTCSNYGKMKDPNMYITEASELAPVSLYAESKVALEQYLLGQNRNSKCKPIVLRFSTVYGLSPRVRFDLTVNEFTRDAVMGRELIIFGEQFWRPYCHVVDLARSVVMALKAEEANVAFEVFNVGDTSENYQKKMLAEEIAKFIPEMRVSYVQRSEDPRDYRVNFDKIRDRLGFRITRTVPDGIRQLRDVIRLGIITNPDDPAFKNV